MIYMTKQMLFEPFCGGTLIHPKWVLTAAHCVEEFCKGEDPSSLRLSAGKIKTSVFSWSRKIQEETVKRVICHPDNCKGRVFKLVDRKPRINDIALVELDNEFEIIVGTVETAPLGTFFDVPEDGDSCITLGWGENAKGRSPKVLYEAKLPIVSTEKCNQPDWRSCQITACMICAGDTTASPCRGDSGGPLFCPGEDGLYRLSGVYSFGRCGVHEKRPAVFTSVASYIEWIHKTLHS